MDENKNLSGFNGWLKFYYVMGIIGLVLGAILLIISLGNFEAVQEASEYVGGGFMFGYVLLFAEAIVSFVYSVKILLIIKQKSGETPKLIQKYILRQSLIVIGLYILSAIMINNALTGYKYIADQLNSTIIRGIFSIILSSAIWYKYFKSAKRVHCYYCEDNNQEIIDQDTNNPENELG